MLGSALARVLAARPGVELVAPPRPAFDARTDDVAAVVAGADVVVNAIGVLASRITDAETAEEVNARFPQRLAAAGPRVVHFTTDGVYSGADGAYTENAAHDATDVYGGSKSRGEVAAPHVLNLRCSIVGPERAPGRSLLAWLLAHPHGAEVRGFEDHRWNGLTTLHLARIVAGTLDEDLAGTAHVLPADTVTKAELLALLAEAFGRRDLRVVPVASGTPADRTLATLDPERNRRLWRGAGYDEPPAIATMARELAAWETAG